MQTYLEFVDHSLLHVHGHRKLVNKPFCHHFRVKFLEDVLVVQILEQDDWFAQLVLDLSLRVQNQRNRVCWIRPRPKRRIRRWQTRTRCRRYCRTFRRLFQQKVAVPRQLRKEGKFLYIIHRSQVFKTYQLWAPTRSFRLSPMVDDIAKSLVERAEENLVTVEHFSDHRAVLFVNFQQAFYETSRHL